MSEMFPLLSLFVVALSYGATACMLSCMPLVSPILLSGGATREASLQLLTPITAGRIAGYTLLSLVAFAGSALIRSWLENEVLMGQVLGTVTLFLAWQLWRAQKQRESCCSASAPVMRTGKGGLFLSGMFLSASFCAPVLSMMALSAAAPSLGWALLYGIVFGIGATLVWFFFFSVVLTAVLKESLSHLQNYRRILERGAPLLLGLVGIALFNGWIKL